MVYVMEDHKKAFQEKYFPTLKKNSKDFKKELLDVAKYLKGEPYVINENLLRRVKYNNLKLATFASAEDVVCTTNGKKDVEKEGNVR